MLLYFKVSNSRSFEKEAELSMISTEVDESSTNSIYNKKYNINILKFASIFGANASGKSNLLKALAEATIMIQESHTYSKNKTNQLKYFPNKTNLKNLNEPTFYKIGFLINNNHFEYSFSNTSERIEKETLIEFKENETEIIHFNRVYIKKKNRYIWTEMSKPFKDKFHFIDPFIKKENLFLSVVSQLSENKEYKIQIADDIYSFLDERIKGDIELKKLWKNEIYLVLTQILKTKQKEKLLKLLEQADFTIKDIIREKKIGNESFKFYTFHSIENEDKKELIKYNLEEESTGTLQFIAWVGYLLFTENKILIIDELDNHMHPLNRIFIVCFSTKK